jgi:hypothetical protein
MTHSAVRRHAKYDKGEGGHVLVITDAVRKDRGV